MEVSGKPSPFPNMAMGGLAMSMNSSTDQAANGMPSSNMGAFPTFPGISPADFGMFLQNSEQLQMFAKAQQLHFQQQMSVAAAMHAHQSAKNSIAASATVTTTDSRYSNEDSPSDFSYSTNGSSSPTQNNTLNSSPAQNVLNSSPHNNIDTKPVIPQDISPVIDRKPVIKNLLPSNASPLATRTSLSPSSQTSPLYKPPTIAISSPSDMNMTSMTSPMQGQGLLAIKQLSSPALSTTSPVAMATASMAGNIFANQMAAMVAQQQGLPGLPCADAVAMGMNPLLGSSNILAKALSVGTSQQRRPRSEKKNIPTDMKDDKYFERRKRNNLAAKKSRDARKYREDEISIRASYLEKENAILRAQVTTLREEANSLRQLMLQKRTRNGH